MYDAKRRDATRQTRGGGGGGGGGAAVVVHCMPFMLFRYDHLLFGNDADGATRIRSNYVHYWNWQRIKESD